MKKGDNMKEKDSIKNFSYKAIISKDGVILLFEDFKNYEPESLRLNHYKGQLFVELGDNVFLLTPKVIDCLLKTPKLFCCTGKFMDYEAMDFIGEIDVNTDLLAQVKGALSVLKMPSP
jgi:hypothetical protein